MGKNHKGKGKKAGAASAAAVDASASGAPSTSAPPALHPLNSIAPFTVPPQPGTAPPMLALSSAHVVAQLAAAPRTWEASSMASVSSAEQKRSIGTWLQQQLHTDGAAPHAPAAKPTSPRTPVTKRPTPGEASAKPLFAPSSLPRGPAKQWSTDGGMHHGSSPGYPHWLGTAAPPAYGHDTRAITTLFVPGLSLDMPIETVYENLFAQLSRFAPLFELRIKDLWHETAPEGWRRVAFASYATPRLALQGFNARNTPGLGHTLRIELSGKETVLDVECSGPIDIAALRQIFDPHGVSPVPLPAALLGEGSQPLTGQLLYGIASLFSPCRLEARQTGVEGTSSWILEFANHGAAGSFLMALAQLPETEPLRCVYHRTYAERQQPRHVFPRPQDTVTLPQFITASKAPDGLSLDDPFAAPPPMTPRILLGADEPETDSPPASPRLPGLFIAGQLAVPASPATPSTPPLDPHMRRRDEPSPPSSPELELRTPGGSSTQATSPLLNHKSSSVFGWGSASVIDPRGLWCGTVPFEMRDDFEGLLRREFATAGEIEDIDVKSLKNALVPDRPRAMAFVQFVSEASVTEALKQPLRTLRGHHVQLKPRERLHMRGSPDRTDPLAPKHLALMPPSPSPSSRKDSTSKGNTPRNAASRKVSDASSHGALGLDLGHIPYQQVHPAKHGTHKNVPRGPAAGWKQNYRSGSASQRGGWAGDHASMSAAQHFLNGPHSPDERQAVAQALAIAHAQVMAHHQRFEHAGHAGPTSFPTTVPFTPLQQQQQQATSMQQQAWPPSGMVVTSATPFVLPTHEADAAGEAPPASWREGVPLPFDASLFYGEAERMKHEAVTPEVQSENMRLYAQPIAIPAWASDD